jgi:hypothetical protein
MARKTIAPIRTGEAGGKIGLRVGPSPMGQLSCGQSAAALARHFSHIRINDRVIPLALVQGSEFRRAVDIKPNETVHAGFARQADAVRSLIAISKQLVG